MTLEIGSNWPVTKRTGGYASYRTLVDRFISAHGQDAREHFYWMNAARVYKLPTTTHSPQNR